MWGWGNVGNRSSEGRGAFGQISMLRSGRGNDTEESNRQSERVGAAESVANVKGISRFEYQASIHSKLV